MQRCSHPTPENSTFSFSTGFACFNTYKIKLLIFNVIKFYKKYFFEFEFQFLDFFITFYE